MLHKLPYTCNDITQRENCQPLQSHLMVKCAVRKRAPQEFQCTPREYVSGCVIFFQDRKLISREREMFQDVINTHTFCVVFVLGSVLSAKKEVGGPKNDCFSKFFLGD